MSKKKLMNWIVSGSLLAVVALVGVSVYQVENDNRKLVEQREEANLPEDAAEDTPGENNTAAVPEEPHFSVVEDEEELIPETEETTEQPKEPAEETAGASVIVPEVNFTEEMMLDWPVEGTVVMDYSMDQSVYFPTLDVYKYNPALVLSAEVGEIVEAAANGRVISIEESIETGTTVTTDLGNGYQLIYGQLKEVLVNENDVISAGTVIGYVNEPTRFYTEEGTNLYFAMKKDGNAIDPVLYLP